MIANLTGDWYWIVLAVIVLFGGSQLPKLAKNAGEAMKEFRKAHNDAMTDTPTSVAAPAPTLPVGAAPAPSLGVGAQPARPLPAGVPSGGAATAAPSGEEKVTLTRAELDALLAHREAQARASGAPPASS